MKPPEGLFMGGTDLLSRTGLWLAAIACWMIPATALAGEQDHNIVPIGRDGPIEVRVHIAPSACLTDEGWLALEIVNHGEEVFDNWSLQFWIDGTTETAAGERLDRGLGTVNGNDYDVWPLGEEPSPGQRGARPIPPGESLLLAGSLPDAVAGILGVPTEASVLVRARFKVDFPPGATDRPWFKMENDDVPFVWRQPNADELRRGYDRLMALLQHPPGRPGSGYLLRALLDAVPPVHPLPWDAVVRAAQNESAHPWSGQAITVHLLTAGYPEDDVLAYIRSRIQQRDDDLLRAFSRAQYWNDALRDEFIEIYTADTRTENHVSHDRFTSAVGVHLKVHGDKWSDDPAATEKLFSIAHHRHPEAFALLQQPLPETLDDRQVKRLVDFISYVQFTRHRPAVSMLCPLLERHEIVPNDNFSLALATLQFANAQRLCDAAAGTMLAVLYGRQGAIALGFPEGFPHAHFLPSREEMDQWAHAQLATDEDNAEQTTTAHDVVYYADGSTVDSRVFFGTFSVPRDVLQEKMRESLPQRDAIIARLRQEACPTDPSSTPP